MSLLVGTIERRSRLNAAKLLLEIYMVLKQIKYCDSDLTLLAYYCLYGATKSTDLRIKEEYYKRLSFKKATSAIHQIRFKLKERGLLLKNIYTSELYLHPDLSAMFSDLTKLGCAIKFTYTDTDEELEQHPETVSI